MNVLNGILGREYGRRTNLSLDFGLHRLQNYPLDISGYSYPEGDPLLCLALNQDVLAVASEKGFVKVIKTSTSYSFNMKITDSFQPHFNAIFDICFRPGHSKELMTVSADQSFSLWDTNVNQCITHSTAHLSSIKSCSFYDCNVFATGSRDGTVKIWDLRQKECVKVISDAHPAVKEKRRKKKTVVRSSPLSCVTCVLFPDNCSSVLTAGASDSAIKAWDIRRVKNEPVSVFSASCPGHGFSSLATDDKSQVYGSCSDHRVYSFERHSGKCTAIFSGNCYRTNNFTRIAVMNDYLVSGSVEGSAPIWSLRQLDKEKTDKITKPILTLDHHEEVAAVAGNHRNEVFSCSDDGKIHKWSLFGNSLETRDENNLEKIRVAKPYVHGDVELEQIVRSPMPSNVASLNTSLSTPRTSSPLSTLTGWLTSNNVDNVLAQTPENSSSRKRRFSKENSSEEDVRSTPLSRLSLSSASEPRAKKTKSIGRKNNSSTPSMKKISDYFKS